MFHGFIAINAFEEGLKLFTFSNEWDHNNELASDGL